MPLKVIGAGYPRTGTASLKVALEQLGLGRCYHMIDLVARASDWPRWTEALDGCQVDFEDILRDYAAITDTPGCLLVRALMSAYPNAKVVLTVRDGERWFRSTQQTILSADATALFGGALPDFNTLMRRMGFHPEDPATHDRETMIARLNAHNEDVQASVDPRRLLVYDVSQGWAPLCEFIGVPIPEAPFPRINTTDDFQKNLRSAGRFDPEERRRAHEDQVQRSRRQD